MPLVFFVALGGTAGFYLFEQAEFAHASLHRQSDLWRYTATGWEEADWISPEMTETSRHDRKDPWRYTAAGWEEADWVLSEKDVESRVERVGIHPLYLGGLLLVLLAGIFGMASLRGRSHFTSACIAGRESRSPYCRSSRESAPPDGRP